MLGQYTLANLTISPNLVLAPMSGVTTRPFRRLIRRYNPGSVGLVVTEFISVEAMTRKVARSLEMMRYNEDERPVAIQIFGYDIERMSDAAKMVEQSGADVLDINCGCPAPKVVRKGGGCELMRQPEHLTKIVRSVRKAIKIPLTLKMRSGWDQGSRNALEVARIAEGEGVQALAVHGRTRAQMYRGEADWQLIYEVARSVNIPVLGSGDVVCSKSAHARMYYNGLAEDPEYKSALGGLMIGRGALENPLVFSEIAAGTKMNLRSDPGLVLEILRSYCDLLAQDFPPKVCIGKVKQLASQMCRGHDWRKEFLRLESFAQQLEFLRKLENSDLRLQLAGEISTPCTQL
ncbi:MAG: tRNA dihydrouridine synthase DusB [Proteobacteria bacterium]|nr:MAG: tRNA dihydrouridine synthase DusB [Pseudomonadota bacterium]